MVGDWRRETGPGGHPKDRPSGWVADLLLCLRTIEGDTELQVGLHVDLSCAASPAFGFVSTYLPLSSVNLGLQTQRDLRNFG